MAVFDLYGSTIGDLVTLRAALEPCLRIAFEEREGGYEGGLYFVAGDEDAEHFVLKINRDPFDGEASEPAFPESRVLFYVNDTTHSEEIAMEVLGLNGLFVLLRHEDL
ncbi:MAG TPA: hypothetical protein VGO61_22675 [Steroidobacteraceae bacterium]|jgi:hypothetical protein|nr:hypothetical protein [Steroidobacteraceae bacterium]